MARPEITAPDEPDHTNFEGVEMTVDAILSLIIKGAKALTVAGLIAIAFGFIVDSHWLTGLGIACLIGALGSIVWDHVESAILSRNTDQSINETKKYVISIGQRLKAGEIGTEDAKALCRKRLYLDRDQALSLIKDEAKRKFIEMKYKRLFDDLSLAPEQVHRGKSFWDK